MRSKFIKTSCLIGSCLLALVSFAQQKNSNIANTLNLLPTKSSSVNHKIMSPDTKIGGIEVLSKKPKIEITNGSFYLSLAQEDVSNDAVLTKMTEWFGISSDHEFKKVSETIDALGFTHANFQQFYNGFLVDGYLVMLHSKEDKPMYLNGRVAQFEDVKTNLTITGEEAKSIALKYLNVTEVINEYSIETVVVNIPNLDGEQIKLTYKIRVDSYKPFTMCNIYVDAESGIVVNKINLIAHADVAGTAQTLYSSNQSITCDSYSGSYRLHDNARKIETYNGSYATGITTSGLIGAEDYSINSTNWVGVPRITSFTVSAIDQSWWYTSFGDVLPDLYIKIKDSSGQIVFTSNNFNNVTPPLVFENLNVFLFKPPYTVELWDFDLFGSDDFGGSYTLDTAIGDYSWLGSGNNGSYSIAISGHPALDVHWGMEKTYDFYSDILNRNSFDDGGSTIKNYYNATTVGNSSVNNAFALPRPYNLMVYGKGDGIEMNPVVGLDVIGHEFTHLVVGDNLVYQGESGALNESFADILGICVEFYSGVNSDWFLGEDVMVNSPFLRSMSNPKDAQQPSTYEGDYWANPSNLNNDHGGVHVNSGVQNYWFYLLSNGGSGINDLSNYYSVDSIGIEAATLIAYRNLETYLGPNATFLDAYYGSLQAAQDLYGNPSAQYTGVRQAWYAVGIGNDPNEFCKGVTLLTAGEGTITDGSDSADYSNNSNCTWVIAPEGAIQIVLTFTEFDTEADYDTVTVYDGPDETFPILAIWWGNTLPPVIKTTSGIGAMCVKFTSDIYVTGGGWSADYKIYGYIPSCSGGTVVATPTGTFTDGSGIYNYGNNQQCDWYIAPPCASSITLSFSDFKTEQYYDGVVIYDGWNETSTLLAVYTGTTIPSSITSYTGEMRVVFISDYSTTLEGFVANYTSTGAAYCSGVTPLNSSDYEIFSDGSNNENYCNNLDCRWLIQPPEATSVTLNFTAFELENSSSDGQTIYDALEVYGGSTISSTLLGRFTGSNLPSSITTTDGVMLVRLISDISINYQGFSAYYTSTQDSYCDGFATKLETASGNVSDGSGSYDYANNTNCSWLIQPEDAMDITLSFSNFGTELNHDGVLIYDGPNNLAKLIGEFSGNTIPKSVTSSGGSMYIEFISDVAVRGKGWSASYVSRIKTNSQQKIDKEKFYIYPNPTEGVIFVNSSYKIPASIEIMDVLGKKLLQTIQVSQGLNSINISELGKGVYLMRVKLGDDYKSERLVVN